MEKIGIGLALIGTFITATGKGGLFEMLPGSYTGNILIILSCIVTAIGFVYSKRSIYDHISPLMVTNIGFILAFFCFVSVSLISYSPSHIITTIMHAPISAHAGVWYMAILSGTVGYFFTNWSEKTLNIGESAIFSYLQPLWAAPAAVLLLQEKITIEEIIGGGVIALGVVLAEYRKRKGTRVRPASNHRVRHKKR